MRRITFLLVALFTLGIVGCVDNEQSFYIEHAKATPEPPDCSISAGDAVQSDFTLNMMTVSSPGITYLATNAVMSQEDYGRLRSESNGIIVDGYEVYTLIPGEGAVGGTEYFEYNHYIAPESTDLLSAVLMTSETSNLIRQQYGCRYFSPVEIADAIFYAWYADELRTNNVAVPADVAASEAAGNTIIAQLNAMGNMPSMMYGVVRFLGHTQGGKEVETPEFTVTLHTYCGVDGGWSACTGGAIGNLCTAFCTKDATAASSCSEGLDEFMTCADYIAGNVNYSIISQEVDSVTGEVTSTTTPICEYLGCE
ncbi:MAG: hypothetical protein JXX29_10715 [Deltaproteobacteria bacterium]|nr:hypothetical protein [Deltaproteobacteria bacterium]MBN2672140.1 hypothetical protein [Deltaproteobacteria bacterium]